MRNSRTTHTDASIVSSQKVEGLSYGIEVCEPDSHKRSMHIIITSRWGVKWNAELNMQLKLAQSIAEQFLKMMHA